MYLVLPVTNFNVSGLADAMDGGSVQLAVISASPVLRLRAASVAGAASKTPLPYRAPPIARTEKHSRKSSSATPLVQQQQQGAYQKPQQRLFFFLSFSALVGMEKLLFLLLETLLNMVGKVCCGVPLHLLLPVGEPAELFAFLKLKYLTWSSNSF